jgi:FixJ family two-component response regulator
VRVHPAQYVTRTLPIVYVVAPDSAERASILAALTGHARRIVTFERGGDYLASESVDELGCILVTLAIADMAVMQFVAAARSRLPVIVVGRTDDLSVAVDMIRAGATDFLEQPSDGRRLRAAVHTATSRIHDGIDPD